MNLLRGEKTEKGKMGAKRNSAGWNNQYVRAVVTHVTNERR